VRRGGIFPGRSQPAIPDSGSRSVPFLLCIIRRGANLATSNPASAMLQSAPEPGALVLFGTVLFGLAGTFKRKFFS
jgi:hypothetical protein